MDESACAWVICARGSNKKARWWGIKPEKIQRSTRPEKHPPDQPPENVGGDGVQTGNLSGISNGRVILLVVEGFGPGN